MAITSNTMVRNISPENVKLLKKLSNIFDIKTTTGVLLRLIPEYFRHQEAIKLLKQKNNKLERELSEARAELKSLKGDIKFFFEIQEEAQKQKENLLSAV
ncbi:MAG: hypothetical protein AAGA43_15380 [Bacteroidota bacterium]